MKWHFNPWRAFLGEFLGMALVLGCLIAVFSLLTDHFLTLTTFRTIANQVPDAIVMAVGMTFVILIGGIDLSVGSVLGLSGSVVGLCLAQWHLPLLVALAAGLLTGMVCGLINGLTIIRWSLPSFIVTLGMLEIARGGAYIVTRSQTKYIGASIEGIAETAVFGLSVPFLIAILVVIMGQLVLTRTTFGRLTVAIGNNEEAVWLSGIDTRSIKLTVFVICSLMSALAAIIQVSRLSAADPNAGIGLELQAIAAVVIGGTSLKGGRGSVVSSFFGVLIIAVLGNGLAQIGTQEPVKRLVTGCVIVIAVVVDYYRNRMENASRS